MKIAVIGIGRFGRSLAESLAERGVEVIAIDKNRERIETVKDKVTLAVVLDSENEEVLRAQGIDKVDVAVVSMGEEDFRSSILTTVILKKLGVKTVVSRAFEYVDQDILENVGADKVVFPEVETGQRLARKLATRSLIDCIPLDDNEDFSIAQMNPPKQFWGKKIGDLQIPTKYGVNIVFVKRRVRQVGKNGVTTIKEESNYVPRADDVIGENDTLWIVGRTEDVESISRL